MSKGTIPLKIHKRNYDFVGEVTKITGIPAREIIHKALLGHMKHLIYIDEVIIRYNQGGDVPVRVKLFCLFLIKEWKNHIK